MEREFALVYMVAGMSSRFDGKIKQFAKVGPNNETLIEYSLNQALPAGFSKIIFIVGNKTETPFKEKFGNSYKGIPIEYALQEYDLEERDRPWGTTDALCSIKNVDKAFVVCNGDDLYGKETFKILTNHLQNKNTNATIGYKLDDVMPSEGTVNRGTFKVNANNEVEKIKENLNIDRSNLEEKGLNENNLCSMNLFALQPELLSELKQIVKNFKERNKDERRKECLLPEDINTLLSTNKITLKLYPTNEQWFGVTNPGDEIKLQQELKI